MRIIDTADWIAAGFVAAKSNAPSRRSAKLDRRGRELPPPFVNELTASNR
jgi:hypothetical protein